MKVLHLGSNEKKNSEKDLNKIEARLSEVCLTKYIQYLLYLVGHGLREVENE